MGLMYGPMPVGGSCQLQAQIQNLFIEAMQFAAPAVQAEQLSGNTEHVSHPHTLPSHVYRELVNSLRDTAVKYRDSQQLRAQISNTLRSAIAPANGGNSPAIPDGYALVPVEPTSAILDEFDSIIDYGAEDSKDAWCRLLASAWVKSPPSAPKMEAE